MAEILVGLIGLLVLLLLFSTGIELGFAMALVGFALYRIGAGHGRTTPTPSIESALQDKS